ncbi:MAG: response regulator transcription factor [Gammaproteobacteria bacterium]|nr:response regulator transcription factor [Gammaproteobacteria bacterium]
MKILLADDHGMVRVGLRLYLQRLFKDGEVLECGNYAEAIAICLEQSDLDLILFDRFMPGVAQTDSLQKFLAAAGTVPVVLVSASEDPAHIWQALDSGARGYIPKTSSEEVMTHALKLVMSGGTYLPPNLIASHRGEAMNAKQNNGLPLQGSIDSESRSPLELTQRQQQVLRLLVYGKSNKQIADSLKISEATVHTHVNAIFKAMNVNNRTSAARRAAELGLVVASEGK